MAPKHHRIKALDVSTGKPDCFHSYSKTGAYKVEVSPKVKLQKSDTLVIEGLSGGKPVQILRDGQPAEVIHKLDKSKGECVKITGTSAEITFAPVPEPPAQPEPEPEPIPE